MKILAGLISAALLSVCAPAWSQAEGLAKPEPPLRVPSDPGMRSAPDTPATPPSGAGMVVVPPKTDQEAVVTPPSNVDPGIHSSTGEIDKKRQGTAEDKQKPQAPQ